MKLLILLLNLLSVTYAGAIFPRSSFYSNNEYLIQKYALRASQINPKLSKSTTQYLAYHILKNALESKLDPELIFSIITVESHFRLWIENPAGDYSLCQINHRIWSKEFQRLGMSAVSKERLINSPAYAIEIMTRILKILKERHSKVDKDWYIQYHSSTKEYRLKYQFKLNRYYRGE